MMQYDPIKIAKATGSKVEDVQKALPLIVKELGGPAAFDHPAFPIAILATAAVECHFKPVTEYGAVAYFKRYEGRKDLGNTQPGDGYKYRGRGYVQITGRANYDSYGKIIGVDLVNNPDLALDPDIAAKILVAYCKKHGIDVWASRGHWVKVRKLVNGGTNGLGPFLTYVWNLLDLTYV